MLVLLAALLSAAGFAQADVDAGVYAALLHETYHGVPASQMVVSGTMPAMRSLQGSSREWLKQFDDIPVRLRAADGSTGLRRCRECDYNVIT